MGLGLNLDAGLPGKWGQDFLVSGVSVQVSGLAIPDT